MAWTTQRSWYYPTVKKINANLIFADEYVSLDKTMLAEGFDLDKCDHNIDFSPAKSEAVRVDLKIHMKNMLLQEGTPAQIVCHLSNDTLRPYRRKVNRDSWLKRLKNIRFDEISEPQVARYIKKAIEGVDSEQLEYLYSYDWQTRNTIRQKIESLLSVYQEKKFKADTDVKCQATYRLPERITVKIKSIGLTKGLYTEEESINGFEYEVINAVANMDNVLFWHRNPSRTGFCINGYMNHYPDFIVQLNSGITAVTIKELLQRLSCMY